MTDSVLIVSVAEVLATINPVRHDDAYHLAHSLVPIVLRNLPREYRTVDVVVERLFEYAEVKALLSAYDV